MDEKPRKETKLLTKVVTLGNRICSNSDSGKNYRLRNDFFLHLFNFTMRMQYCNNSLRVTVLLLCFNTKKKFTKEIPT